MKIDNVTQSNIALLDTAHKKLTAAAVKTAQSQTKQPSEAFSVQISAAVDKMKSSQEDDVRRDKVAAIRDRLASGTYNISGKDVANKILNALKG